MENEQKDIIRQLAEKLKAHQEPYKPGAWEQFLLHEARENARQKKTPMAAGQEVIPVVEAQPTTNGRNTTDHRPIRRLYWVGVAAAILLALGASWFFITANHSDQSNQLTQKSNMPADADQTLSPEAGATASPTPKIVSGPQKAPGQLTKPANKTAQQPGLVNGQQSQTGGQQNPAQWMGSPAGTALIASRQQKKKAAAKSPASKQGPIRLNAPHPIHHPAVIALQNHFSKGDQEAASALAANALAAINTKGYLPTPGLRISPVGPVFTLVVPAGPGTTKGADLAKAGTNKKNNAPISKADKANNWAANQTGDRQLATSQQAPAFDDHGYFDGTGKPGDARKWQMGVMVMPALSNSAKLNMGYGLSVGYRLNKRLTLSSGLAYTQLSGTKDASTDQGQGLASIASSGRTLTALDASVAGLNVPLEIRYQVSRKIYVGTGVSAMAVLSDKVERRYAIAQMQSTALDASMGHALKPDAMQSIASNLKTREVIPESEVGAKDFAGFINFNLGFKQPLNKSKSLFIEPFVRVPMSNHLFNQQIKMTDGGIKIKLGL